MPAKVDAVLLHALSHDPSTTSIHNHGGSSFASPFRLTTSRISIFVKTSPGPESAVMFEGENASLNAIHDAVPGFCPKSFAWGKKGDGQRYFLAIEFLDHGGWGGIGGSQLGFSQKLVKLYATRASVAERYHKPMFGFPVTTCCGDTPRDNSFEAGWADFFGERRLLATLERSEGQNGKDSELRKTMEKTVSRVVPRLLGEGHLGGRDSSNPDEAGAVEDVILILALATLTMNLIMALCRCLAPLYRRSTTSVVSIQIRQRSLRTELGYKSGVLSILKALNKKYGH
jgi:protein-ribulosamine 3-kinase